MKIMQVLVLIFFSFMSPSNVFGISILYNGFECLETADTNDPTPKSMLVPRKLEVMKNVWDGVVV